MPTLTDLYRNVMVQLEQFCHKPPGFVKPYTPLRDSVGADLGLGMDDQFLTQFGDVLNKTVLMIYHKKLKPAQCAAKGNKFVKDLFPLVDSAVKASIMDRAIRLAKRVDGDLAKLRPQVEIVGALPLRSAPLFLIGEEIEWLRLGINAILGRYQNPIGITAGEMARVVTVENLHAQIASEVSNSSIFP